MPIKRTTYNIPPSRLMPNCPPEPFPSRPLIHYQSFFDSSQIPSPPALHTLFTSNGWSPKWIFRYGTPHPISHYHSAAHECMIVLTGEAQILFGAADLSDDDSSSPSSSSPLPVPPVDTGLFGGKRQEPNGLILTARAGDVFILPAGLGHKAVDPTGEFALLTRGAHEAVSQEELEGIELAGFTMMGAYPADEQYGDWDFMQGGEDAGSFEKVWSVPKPECDPVLGRDAEGLCRVWTG